MVHANLANLTKSTCYARANHSLMVQGRSDLQKPFKLLFPYGQRPKGSVRSVDYNLSTDETENTVFDLQSTRGQLGQHKLRRNLNR